MNAFVRRLFQATPVLRDLYGLARARYNRLRVRASAKGYFRNVDEYLRALEIEDDRKVDIRTKDGLVITIRRNFMDAAILGEVFLDESYVRGLVLPDRPTVVDIGGYIGDFALFAAKRLNARRVVVCEPSPRNWDLLQKNVANNSYGDRIEMVNKAVTDGEDVMMNVEASDRGQARVSAYGPGDVPRQRIPGVSLASLMESHGLDTIDLLKIDCEGGEYAILSGTPSEALKRIRNIVFEFHEIDGFQAKLDAVKRRLASEGYSLRVHGDLVYASRH